MCRYAEDFQAEFISNLVTEPFSPCRSSRTGLPETMAAAGDWDPVTGHDVFTEHGVPDALPLFLALVELGHRSEFDDIRERYFDHNGVLLKELVDTLIELSGEDERTAHVKARIFSHLVASDPDRSASSELGLSLVSGLLSTRKAR